MDARRVRERLSAALEACHDGPWEHGLPWADPAFARRFVRVTDEESSYWGPPEPDVNRLLDAWGRYHRVDTAGRPSVLDLACGAGRHAIALAWMGCDVVGVDVGRPAIDRATGKAARERLNGELSFVHADIADYEPGRAFDVVQLLAGQCANFRAEALALLLRRYLTMLTPGGMLVIELPGLLPEAETVFREPDVGALLFADFPYWELKVTEVDAASRLVSDRYAILTVADEAVAVYANWRLFYPADWIAQMLPSRAVMRVDTRDGRPDWCVIANGDVPVADDEEPMA